MCLVQHDNGVLSDVRVDQALALQHTIRHVLDARLRTGAILETDGIPDLLTKTATDLFTDTFRHRHSSDTTGLRTPYKTVGAVAILVKELCQLRGLSRASLADNDNNC